MRWYIPFIIGCLLLPAPVFGEEKQLIVDGLVTLSTSQSFSYIHVLPGGVLTILPGVRIGLSPGAWVEVEGVLALQGTPGQKIVFVADTDPWASLTVTSTGVINWSNVLFQNATGPFSLAASEISLESIELRDVLESRIAVHITDSFQSFHVVNSVFSNPRIGTGLKSVGFEVQGPLLAAEFINLTYPSSTYMPSDSVVAHVLGQHTRIEFGQVRTQDLCYAIFSPYSDPAGADVTAIFNPKCAPKEPSLLFIPGLGGSLNAKYLSEADPGDVPPPASWSFLPVLTDSYKTFLNMAGAAHIPFMTMFYDWRRTPEEIIHSYLLPAIDTLLKRDKTFSVRIVAHSYGGIVAAMYLASSEYRGDVVSLTTLGTPYLGSARIYGLWEGAVFPSDMWFAVSLLRYYQLQYLVENHSTLSDIDGVHRYFPGLLSLFPAYSALLFQTKRGPPLVTTNTAAQLISANATRITSLVQSWKIIAGTGTQTLDFLGVDTPNPGSQMWPDGQANTDTFFTENGDGQVVHESAIPTWAVDTETVTAGHGDLPAVAGERVLHALYPAQFVSTTAFAQVPTNQETIAFSFDCPVTVKITAPDGSMVDSATDNGVHSVRTEGFTWLILPKLKGSYAIEVTALADTDVRWWVDAGEIHTTTLKKSELYKVVYKNNSASSAPTPTNTPSASAKPTPQPSLFKGETIISPSPSISPKPQVVLLPSQIKAKTPEFLIFLAPLILVFLLVGLYVRRRFGSRHPP